MLGVRYATSDRPWASYLSLVRKGLFSAQVSTQVIHPEPSRDLNGLSSHVHGLRDKCAILTRPAGSSRESLLASGLKRGHVAHESIATILERTTSTTIEDWYEHALLDPTLTVVPMSRELRCAHLPQLFRDLVFRLRSPTIPGTEELFSEDAAEHGIARRRQGYTAAMMVEESRILQVSIFRSLHENSDFIAFPLLLPDVMTIANEVDAQLSRAMACYVAESHYEGSPA